MPKQTPDSLTQPLVCLASAWHFFLGRGRRQGAFGPGGFRLRTACLRSPPNPYNAAASSCVCQAAAWAKAPGAVPRGHWIAPLAAHTDPAFQGCACPALPCCWDAVGILEPWPVTPSCSTCCATPGCSDGAAWLWRLLHTCCPPNLEVRGWPSLLRQCSPRSVHAPPAAGRAGLCWRRPLQEEWAAQPPRCILNPVCMRLVLSLWYPPPCQGSACARLS